MEIVGLVASVTSLIQVLASGWETLQQFRNVGTDIARVSDDLNVLIQCLKDLQDAIDLDNPTFQRFKERCDDVDRDLKRVRCKLTSGRSRKIIHFLGFRQAITNLQESLKNAQTSLQIALLYSLHKKRKHVPIALPPGTSEAAPPVDGLASKTHLQLKNQSVQTSFVDSENTSLFSRMRSPQDTDSSKSQYTCSCQHPVYVARRFWAFQYSPIAAPCGNEKCQTKRSGVSLRVALTQFGMQWTIAIESYIIRESGGFALKTGLRYQKTVPYTSPGFEVLWKCNLGLISFEKASDALAEMCRDDRDFKDHVDPAGMSYIETLLEFPWKYAGREVQWRLLKLFLSDMGMTQGLYSTSFLPKCARWIGEGPHLDILEYLIHLGYDPSHSPVPDAAAWPETCSPDWISESMTPDPFFHKYLATLCTVDRGFADIPPLHEAILIDSHEEVVEWIRRSPLDQINFLGQSSIHLAVPRPKILFALAEAGHDVNALDRYGMTPLMYAAALGYQESAIHLLRSGANPYIREPRFGRHWFHYANVRDHWDVAFAVITELESMDDGGIVLEWWKAAALFFCIRCPYDVFSQTTAPKLESLLARAGSLDFLFEYDDTSNNTLLHVMSSAEDVRALLTADFTLVNHTNSRGQNALLGALGRCFNAGLIEALVAAGVDIHARDEEGQSALFLLLSRLNEKSPSGPRDSELWTMLRILLSVGSICNSNDACRCPCSPNGCLPSATFYHRRRMYTDARPTYLPALPLEWLHLVQEYRGTTQARTILLAYLRRLKHDKLEITHSCCYRRPKFPRQPQRWRLPMEDAWEIAEEESELIEDLETQMKELNELQIHDLWRLWFAHLKTDFDAALKQFPTFQPESKLPVFQSRVFDYEIDRSKDEFVQRIRVAPSLSSEHPRSAVISHASDYKVWIEMEHLTGHAAALARGKKDKWRMRRVSKLREFLNIIGIRTEEVCGRSNRALEAWLMDAEKVPLTSQQELRKAVASWDFKE